MYDLLWYIFLTINKFLHTNFKIDELSAQLINCVSDGKSEYKKYDKLHKIHHFLYSSEQKEKKIQKRHLARKYAMHLISKIGNKCQICLEI